MGAKRDVLERFESKVDKLENGCWQWKAGLLNKKRVGRFYLNAETDKSAKYASLLLYKEEPTGSGYIINYCDNDLCVNPDHLYTGSKSDYMQRAVKQGKLIMSDERREKSSLINRQMAPYRREQAGIKEKNGYFKKGTYVKCKFHLLDHNAPIFGDKLIIAKVEGGKWFCSDTGQKSYELKLKDLDISVWGDDFERVSKEQLRNLRIKEAKLYIDSHREQVRTYNTKASLMRGFGLSYETFLKMKEDQNDLCKICGKPETNKNNKRLSVDHCHTSGIIRGLLCSRCNSALGLFQDNISILMSAINYLKESYGNSK